MAILEKKMGKKTKNQVILIEKRNVLNSMRNCSLTMPELKLLSIYLARINARDVKTRLVKIPLSEYMCVMDIGEDINLTHLRESVRHLLQHVVEVPNEKGHGYTAFQLFKRCKVEKDEKGIWTIEIDAHDDSLPLMFNFKKEYFTYELQNALNLKSSNQIRMYEILKQYENVGKRELSIIELRSLLGIKDEEYPRWNNFRAKVLDSCQRALEEYTDITFTYEKGTGGAGGKWLSIIFNIYPQTPAYAEKKIENFCSGEKAEEIQEEFIDEDDIPLF